MRVEERTPTPALPVNGDGEEDQPRREFVRSDVEKIRALIEENHGALEYVADPEALQYRESLTISAKDQEFIERVYEAAEAEDEVEGVVEEG